MSTAILRRYPEIPARNRTKSREIGLAWLRAGVAALWVIPALAGCATPGAGKAPPLIAGPDFVPLGQVDSSIIQEIRYATPHNFVGRKVQGYGAPKCILTQEAAKALAQVQSELVPYGLSLKVYDCYRPQRAVADFVAWAKDVKDLKMKDEFYPAVDKKNLFKDGYIAEKSGHSRGSTMDLTLVPLPAGPSGEYVKWKKLRDCRLPARRRFRDNSLDMGTGYDCFDPLAHTDNHSITPEEQRNRLLLKSVMEKHGFKNLPEEWWHFTLIAEPYPDRYFDIPIE